MVLGLRVVHVGTAKCMKIKIQKTAVSLDCVVGQDCFFHNLAEQNCAELSERESNSRFLVGYQSTL